MKGATPPLFHPNLRGVPLRLDYRCSGSEERSPKLIIRVITYELTQHTIRPQRYGRTDGRTTYDSNTALVLRASRGKKSKIR